MSFKEYLKESIDKDKEITAKIWKEKSKVGEQFFNKMAAKVYNDMKKELESITDNSKLIDKAFNEIDPYKAQVYYSEYNGRSGTPGF